MAAAKWQQANGAKKMRKRTAKNGQVRNSQPEKCENERKSATTVENQRKQARKSARAIELLFVDRFLATFSDHIAVAI